MKKGNKKTNYKFAKILQDTRDAIAADRSAFHDPAGNNKTGASIPCWNMVPGITCSGQACAHCLQQGCYAVKNMIRGGYNIESNTTYKAWVENTAFAMNHLDLLEKCLRVLFSSMAAPRYFRIHSAGDFFSVEYAEMWKRLAHDYPGTRFLAFSKQWDVIRAVKFYEQSSNFSLVLSGWTGCRVPEDLINFYPVAWCNDGIQDRIPEDAFPCPGACDSCGYCWNMKKGDCCAFDKH